MTPQDEPDSQPDHRAYYEASGDDIEIRQPDDEDGVFEIRMPIVSTGEVRNEGDNPFTRDELEGMAQQIGNGVVSVFPDHGQTAIGGPNRYSIGEKGGEWQDAEVVGEQDTESDAAELVATARLMDPDTLPDIPIREMLGTIKELVNRDMSVPSSIGWKEDDAAPGGNDLMEASIVGIPADPRTTSDAETAVVARAAIEAGADPEALVASVREAVQDTDDHEMSDEDTESDTEADAEQDEQPGETQDEAAEFRERMLELQEAQMETLEAVAEAVREDDMDDDEDEDDDEEENEGDHPDDEDEDEDENAADEPDEDEERDLASEVEALREELAEVRSGDPGEGVDTPDPDDEQDADGDDAETRDENELTTKYGIQ